jgi:hypothetical protein
MRSDSLEPRTIEAVENCVATSLDAVQCLRRECENKKDGWVTMK